MNSSSFSKADKSALIYMANDLKNRSLYTEKIKRLSERMDKMEEETSNRIKVLESKHKILESESKIHKSEKKTIKKLQTYPLLIRQLIHESK
jgi:hypothetical protein